ncbi:MAG: CapA family protein, partial [Candidatus Dormibacteraeota bacterium]|nr:CapA family protein [Candidatus Dormibacteraeota bacterium]
MPDQRVDGAQQLRTRREILRQAGRLGIGAAAFPMAGWLAACSRDLAPMSPSASATAPATSARPTDAPVPTATPDARPVTVAITGDVMLGRSINAAILSSSDRYPFNEVADYLHGFDVTVGNLECVVSAIGQPVPNKPYHFRADPKSYGRLNAAGFDIVSLANNHSGDYGRAAFTDMLAQMHAHGLTPLGAGLTLTGAHAPVITTVRSTTIGFLAYCEVAPTSFAATRSSPGHAWLDPALMRSDITSVRAHVDYLIVFMHWGIEYQRTESGHQQSIARLAVEAGADLVVGSHPHVVQPFEMYGGRPIVYSLGNFVFDEMLSDDVRRGEVLALTIQGAHLVDWKLR